MITLLTSANLPFLQRRDYGVLRPFLPPKLEFTLMVKLSDLQKKLYESYLEKARSRTTRKVLADFQALSRVWTHPRSIQMKDEQDDEKEEMVSQGAAGVMCWVVGVKKRQGNVMGLRK